MGARGDSRASSRLLSGQLPQDGSRMLAKHSWGWAAVQLTKGVQDQPEAMTATGCWPSGLPSTPTPPQASAGAPRTAASPEHSSSSAKCGHRAPTFRQEMPPAASAPTGRRQAQCSREDGAGKQCRQRLRTDSQPTGQAAQPEAGLCQARGPHHSSRATGPRPPATAAWT